MSQFVVYPYGDTAILYCNATSTSPIRYRWYKNGRKLSGRSSSLITNQPYLIFKGLVLTDTATYRCKAKIKGMKIEHDFKLIVQEKVVKGPYIDKNEGNYETILTGSNASLPCDEIRSSTLPDFRWLRWNGAVNLTILNKIAQPGNGIKITELESMVEIVPADRYRQVSKSKNGHRVHGVELMFPKVTVADRGFYTCLVLNHIGYDYKTTYLSVENAIKPVIQRIRSKVFIAQSGTDFNFPECKVLFQSKPPVKITWEKLFSTITNERHVIRGNRVMVKKVQHSDAGYYTCIARNSAGEDQVKILLRVWPLVMNKTSAEIITRLRNETVEIFCSAYGHTQNMTGTIVRMGVPVPSAVERKKDNLFLVKAQVNEDGTYVCTITNGNEKVQSASFVEKFHLKSVILNSTSIEHLGKWLKESKQLGRYKACWDTNTYVPNINSGGMFFTKKYCGGKKNTITLIQIRDKWVSYYRTPNRDWDTTLGGFTEIAWTQGTKANSTKTFMFEFNPPKKYTPRFGGKNAICGYGSGPCFGNKNLYTAGFPPYAYGSRGNIWKIRGVWYSRAVFDILKFNFAQGYPRRMEVFYRL
ncbi:neural cell adhesion molecule 1-like isoform X1 [Clytia hemisphaerica]